MDAVIDPGLSAQDIAFLMGLETLDLSHLQPGLRARLIDVLEGSLQELATGVMSSMALAARARYAARNAG
jgi:hypothetical protein